MKQNLSKLLLAATTLFAASALSAQVTVVHWEGDYVSANTGLARGETSNSSLVDYLGNPGRHNYKAWDETTPLNPSANYTAPAGRSSTFYGGRMASYSSISGGFLNATNQILNNAAGDRIQFNNQVGTNDDFTARHGSGAIGFLKNDFLNGGNTQGVFFDATSSMTMDFATLHSPLSARFMVKQDDVWYISNTAYTGGGVKTLGGNDLLDETWAVYDPTSNFLFFDASAATFDTVSFINIQGLGYQVQFIETDTLTSGQITANLLNFEVLAAIPEPSTYAALFGLMALGLILWRRRR